MATNFSIRFALVHVLFLSIAVVNCTRFRSRSFNVRKYGAVSNLYTDNSQAFVKAWKDACIYEGRGRVVVPRGVYKVKTASFEGPCNGSTSFVIRGVLKAPTNPSEFSSNTWIAFRYINRLFVSGGGYLDGQGAAAWKYNNCRNNPNCMQLPATLRFDFVTNARVHHLKSINSKNTHFNIFACKNMSLYNIRLTAPEDSPNTDGIKMGESNNIKISNSVISTGDDCIAMLNGSENIDISGVSCGPGHGISIGSLGKSRESEHVSGIHVRNCTFTKTDNGVRIKTWGTLSARSLASNITFQDIVMKYVQNPIVIDQQYCPIPHCLSGHSSVQIQDVLFKNIWGISSTKVAVKIVCSGLLPCKNVKLIDISLAYRGRGGAATALCTNVWGKSYGRQMPHGCV